MKLRLSAWRPGHLLGAWCAYWVGLVLVTIAPGLPVLWRVTRPGAHGSASVSVDDGVLKLLISDAATAVWTREIGLGTIALWVGLPPLVLWALWLWAQRGRRSSVAAGRAL